LNVMGGCWAGPMEPGPERVTVGAGGSTVLNVMAFEVAPPAVTVMEAEPGWATRFAGTAAVTCPAPMTVVTREVEFQKTTAFAVKPVPFTVSVNGALPAVAVEGLRPVMVSETGLMVNVRELEVCEFPLETVTLAVAAVARRLAGMAAVSCVALAKAVASGEPFHCTAEVLVNPVPVALRVMDEAPAVAEFGEMDVSESGGGVMAKASVLDTAAFGPGFATAMFALPAAVVRLAGTSALS
jgi:hypothetical protein